MTKWNFLKSPFAMMPFFTKTVYTEFKKQNCWTQSTNEKNSMRKRCSIWVCEDFKKGTCLHSYGIKWNWLFQALGEISHNFIMHFEQWSGYADNSDRDAWCFVRIFWKCTFVKYLKKHSFTARFTGEHLQISSLSIYYSNPS